MYLVMIYILPVDLSGYFTEQLVHVFLGVANR